LLEFGAVDGLTLLSPGHVPASAHGSNVASIASNEGNPNAAAYSAAKAGVIA
jgi:NAD(P)-dependent dehydrogenase (short-subunit alcohol dehydrogenase family)